MSLHGHQLAASRLIDAMCGAAERIKTRLRMSPQYGLDALLMAEIEERGGTTILTQLTGGAQYVEITSAGFGHPFILVQTNEAASVVAFLTWVRLELDLESRCEAELEPHSDLTLFSAICEAVLGQLTTDLPRWRAHQQEVIAR